MTRHTSCWFLPHNQTLFTVALLPWELSSSSVVNIFIAMASLAGAVILAMKALEHKRAPRPPIPPTHDPMGTGYAGKHHDAQPVKTTSKCIAAQVPLNLEEIDATLQEAGISTVGSAIGAMARWKKTGITYRSYLKQTLKTNQLQNHVMKEQNELQRAVLDLTYVETSTNAQILRDEAKTNQEVASLQLQTLKDQLEMRRLLQEKLGTQKSKQQDGEWGEYQALFERIQKQVGSEAMSAFFTELAYSDAMQQGTKMRAEHMRKIDDAPDLSPEERALLKKILNTNSQFTNAELLDAALKAKTNSTSSQSTNS